MALDKEKKRIRDKKYYEKHKKECNQRSKEYRLKNKEKLKQYFIEYKNLNREKINKRNRSYKKSHQQYYNNRRKTDLNFKLAGNIRARLNKILRNNIKIGSGIKDLGCTVSELKNYLESLFQPGMTWENYGHGKGKWNIDHIRPLISFNLSNRDEFLEANNYKNLQPMWHQDNIRKNNKWVKSN